MPNKPARTPTATPAQTTSTASQMISLSGIPSTMLSGTALGCSLGGLIGALSQLGKSGKEHVDARAGLDRFGREMAPEGARPGHRPKQAEQMPGDRMQPGAARQLALDIGYQSERSVFNR